MDFRSTSGSSSLFKGKDLMIVTTNQKVSADGTEIEWPTPYWLFDAGYSYMILLITAVNEGSSASFTRTLDIAGFQRLLNMLDELHPDGVISIGCGDADVSSPSMKRGRRALKDAVHYKRWRSHA